VHFLAPGTTPEAFAAASFVEFGDFVDRPFRVDAIEPERVVLSRDGSVASASRPQTVGLTKVLRFGGSRRAPELALEVTVEHRGDAGIDALLAVEWATTMLGGGGNPSAFYRIGGEAFPHDSSGRRANVNALESGNRDVGLTVSTTVSPAAEAWWSSIDTISTSEEGFERTHQGSCLVLVWPVRLGPGERITVTVSHTVLAGRDLADDEGL
jgi:alpha-amylase